MNRRIFLKVFTFIAAIVCLLVTTGVLSAQGRGSNGLERALEAQARHSDKIMEKQGVVGTAVGLGDDGNPAVLVLLENSSVAGIPGELDGVKVKKMVTGKIYALPKGSKPEKPGGKPGGGDNTNPKKRFNRPVPIGVSTGNEGQCSAGTIGCRLTDGSNYYALSNNHVYALGNSAQENSSILQPGRYDVKPPCTFIPEDEIGILWDYIPLKFGGTNTVDAAIAKCESTQLGKATPSNGYGTPSSQTADATIGMSVQKYGRTTGLTSGTILAINGTVNVEYSQGIANFINQIIISGSSFSNSGDSGSLIVTNNDDCNPVGLLFAGGSNPAVGPVTVANPIKDVLDAFSNKYWIDGK